MALGAILKGLSKGGMKKAATGAGQKMAGKMFKRGGKDKLGKRKKGSKDIERPGDSTQMESGGLSPIITSTDRGQNPNINFNVPKPASKASSKPASLGQLKLTVENIKNSIGTSNATLSKIRIKNKKFLDKQVDKAAKGREEKKLEKSPLKSVASTVGGIGKSIAAGPMNIFSKLWQFGSLMLMGILVTNLPIIIEKIMGVVRAISNIGSGIANGFKTIGNIVGKITGGGNKEHEEKKKKFDKDVESLEKKGEEVKNIIPKSIRDKFQWIKDALAGKGGKETLKKQESVKEELEEHQKNQSSGSSTQISSDTSSSSEGLEVKSPAMGDSSNTSLPKSSSTEEKGTFTPVKAKPRLGTRTSDGWEKSIGVEVYPEGNYLESEEWKNRKKVDNQSSKINNTPPINNTSINNTSINNNITNQIKHNVNVQNNITSISPIKKKEKSLQGLESVSDGGNTIIVATQPVIQPFPVSQVIPVNSSSNQQATSSTISGIWES